MLRQNYDIGYVNATATGIKTDQTPNIGYVGTPHGAPGNGDNKVTPWLRIKQKAE